MGLPFVALGVFAFATVNAVAPDGFYPNIAAGTKATATFRTINMLMSHDAGAVVGQQTSPAGQLHAAVCQDKDMATQFTAGVRIFDVRVAEEAAGVFKIVHEYAKQNILYQPAAGELYNLWKAIPDGDFAIIKLGKSADVVPRFLASFKTMHADAQLREFHSTDEVRAWADSKISDAANNKKLIILKDTASKQWKHAFPAQIGIHPLLKLVTGNIKENILQKWHKSCNGGTHLKISFSTTGTQTKSPLDNAIANQRWLVQYLRIINYNPGCFTIVSGDGMNALINFSALVVGSVASAAPAAADFPPLVGLDNINAKPDPDEGQLEKEAAGLLGSNTQRIPPKKVSGARARKSRQF